MSMASWKKYFKVKRFLGCILIIIFSTGLYKFYSDTLLTLILLAQLLGDLAVYYGVFDCSFTVLTFF